MELTASSLVLLSLLSLSSCGRLNVHPDRSWFFRYDTVTFSCSDSANSSAAAAQGRWSVRRNTSTLFSRSCDEWDTVEGTSCSIDDVYTTDSGLYWCETELKQRSSAVRITVTSHPVILSAPVHPVLQGAPFSLMCLCKEQKDHVAFEASFFKDGVFIDKLYPAVWSFPKATPKDGGLYSCEHPDGKRSAAVLLTVSERSVSPSKNQTSDSPAFDPGQVPFYRWLCFGLLFLLYTAILCIGVCVCRRWARAGVASKQRRADLQL